MAAGSQTTAATPYPVQFFVEYPERDLNRLTTGFRIIVAIPILVVAAAIGGHWWGGGPALGAGSVTNVRRVCRCGRT